MNDFDKPNLFSPGVGNRGMTQLHYDAYCGNLPGLLWCLEHGMDVNATENYRGYTATHWLADMAAADGPRVEMLKALVGHGADVNLRTPDGITPLMLARAAGSDLGDELASELIALGAGPE
jgi:ankyrin repeat protein